MDIISVTIGRVCSRYRRLSDWIDIYRRGLYDRDVSDKTKRNRSQYIKRIEDRFGSRRIGSIRPHEISTLVYETHRQMPTTGRLVLIEAKSMFAAAVDNGWLIKNPASELRYPRVIVARARMTLDQWRALHDEAITCSQPWVQSMLMLALVTAQRRGDLCRMRFDDVQDGYLRVRQQKTEAKIMIPLALRLDAVGRSVGDVIDECRWYAPPGDTLLRNRSGDPISAGWLSVAFDRLRSRALGEWVGDGTPPSLHECRSLAERLYRAQGVDTLTLLGHRRQRQTDRYNYDRGLSEAAWRVLRL